MADRSLSSASQTGRSPAKDPRDRGTVFPVGAGYRRRLMRQVRWALDRPGEENDDHRDGDGRTRPAIWLRAPMSSFTAVREPLAPIEKPCVNPAATFAVPSAPTS